MVVIDDLVWNELNIAHIARHKVKPEEVEDVIFGNSIISKTYSNRLRVIGKTKIGRMLTVIIYPRSTGVWFVITARSASKKERKFYEEKKGEKI